MSLYVAKSRELVELVVLGLLRERPRHPYDLLRELKRRGNTSFVRGLPRSLYHAVDALEQQGLLVAGDVARDGARPERTVYWTTEAGRAAHHERLVALLERPSDQPTFFAALSLVAGLTREDAAGALARRADALDVALADGRERRAQHADLPRLFLVEIEYLQDQLQAEADWVRRIVAEIEAGTLDWDWRAQMAAARTTAPAD